MPVGRSAEKPERAGGRPDAEELKPDIIILDISMPDLNGVEAAKRIRKASAAVEILFYPCIIPSNSYVKLWMPGYEDTS